jgi:heme/copper-type cytochrome/quinol oxidase subunit 3
VSEQVVRRWRELTEETTTPQPRSASLAWWGVVLLIATEATLFAMLVFSYFYLRWTSKTGWPPDGLPDPKIVRPLIMTVILAGSGITAFMAERAIRRNDQLGLRGGLALTFLGGSAWLGLQAWDYTEKVKIFTPKTDAYGSLVYTLTGAHAAHLIAGVLLLGWVLLRSWTGAYEPRHHLAVSIASLYWYFVVVVGIVVFAAVVLSPYS